jgi:hypothetical protein
VERIVFVDFRGRVRSRKCHRGSQVSIVERQCVVCSGSVKVKVSSIECLVACVMTSDIEARAPRQETVHPQRPRPAFNHQTHQTLTNNPSQVALAQPTLRISRHIGATSACAEISLKTSVAPFSGSRDVAPSSPKPTTRQRASLSTLFFHPRNP